MRLGQGRWRVRDPRSRKRRLLILLFLSSVATCIASAPKPSYGFTAAVEPSNIFSRYTGLSDVNGDGILDIVSLDNAGLLVTLGNGDGTYQQPIRTDLNDFASAFAIADIDGDSRQDLIVYSGPVFSAQSLTVLLGLGDGAFRLAGKITLLATAVSQNLPGANPIPLADFDGNGLPDIAMYNGRVSLNGSFTDTVSVRLNQGNGTFGSPVTYQLGTSTGLIPVLIVVGDFNNDGSPDIATASSQGRISVILGTGTGAFGSPLAFSASLDAGTQITNLAVADLNNDGMLDLITAQSWSIEPTRASVGVYLGKGDGRFALQVTYKPSVIDVRGIISVYAGALLPVDLTGDGILDLVESNYRTSSFGEIIVFPGNGDGSFRAASVYQISSQPSLLSAADLNYDGRVDLVVTSPSSASQLSALQILNGRSGPNLRIAVTHNGPTYLDQQAQFSVQVTNLGDEPTSGSVVLNPGVQNSAAGWNCGYSIVNGIYIPECTRSEILAPGASYPALQMVLEKPDANNPQNNPAVNVIVSGGGSARSNGLDSAQVIRFNSRCPFVFLTGTTDGIVYKQTVVSRLGGTFFLSVGASQGCPWQASSNAPWLSAPSPFNSSYTVQPNTTGATRTAILSFTSITGWSDTITLVQAGQQCLYRLDPRVTTLSSQGQQMTFFVNVESGCPVNPTVNVDWLRLSPLQATGSSWFLLEASANSKPVPREAFISVGGAVTHIYQYGSNQAPALGGIMAQFAVGGGWETTFQIVNASTNIAKAGLATLGGSGGGIQGVPAYVDDEGFHTNTYLYTLDRVLQPHATVGIHSAELGSVTPTVGSASLQFDPGIAAFVRFRYAPNGQEAMVPMETRMAKSFTLGFDNTNGIVTGIAIAAGSYKTIPTGIATIAVTVRDDAGNMIDSTTVSMNVGTHDSYLLSDRFPRTAGRSGTVQFATAAAGQISVIGLRSPPSLRFSTIPPASEIDPGNGTMSQLAVGGGWSTTVEMINTTAAPAPAQLTFSTSNGAPLVLPLSYSGTMTSASQLQQTLPPKGRLVVNIAGADSAAPQIGSARMASGTGVSGFIRYSYVPLGQDAIVPLETRQAAGYIFPFDNTGGAVTGVAVANSGSAAVTIPVTLYDVTGTQVANTAVSLPAHGQTAFILGDRIAAAVNTRGSVQFTTPDGGTISVLGLRYPASGAFTTIPVSTP